MTDLHADDLGTYLLSNLSSEPDLLAELNRETNVRVLKPQMLSGHYQGRVLSFMSHMLAPLSILEIGTYTGYSALCLAEGLQKGGRLITIELNPEVLEIARAYFARSAFSTQIISLHGDAALLIPGLTEVFDLVFIDADKKRNQLYYELALAKLRPGGVMLIDNMLWYGKVLTNAEDKKTQAVSGLNEFITLDPRVENLILPIRDGIHMLRKK